MALIFASAVSEFKFFLSLWSGISCNLIMWHVRLVFNALSLLTRANLACLGSAAGAKSLLRGKDVHGVGPALARLDLLDPQLALLADTSLPITIRSLFLGLSLSSLILSFSCTVR